MNNSDDYQNRLFQILNNESFSSEFISGIAGDRVQDKEEKILYDKLLHEAGDDFYVKLLFFITHEVFEKQNAFKLWNEIIEHKNYLSSVLNRNVEITVATLDYLSNIKKELSKPQLIGETFIGKIAELSSVDPLTKLFNRQHLKQVLDNEFIRYKRYKIAFSIVFIDIDRFKNVNDTLGHKAGDDILISVTNSITSDLRDLDICTRYGGDEFVLVLPHTNQSKAYEIAERIRKKVETHSYKLSNITLSMGIACCPYHANTLETLMAEADKAVYMSKDKGKNQTSMKRKLF
jgi:diguanylate cyclase (GGDEF)-like protein